MTWTGMIVAAAVLLFGTAAGLWRRRVDGRLTPVSSSAPAPAAPSSSSPSSTASSSASSSHSSTAPTPVSSSPSFIAPTSAPSCPSSSAASAASAPSAASALSSAPSALPSTAPSITPSALSSAAPSSPPFFPAHNGIAVAEADPIDANLLAGLGVQPARATLLQFSSAFCAPCRAVRRVSSEVADMIDGVQHIEVDAESRLDAVRALGIWKTPTLLILDADGRVTKRATGVPAKPHLIAALGEILTR